MNMHCWVLERRPPEQPLWELVNVYGSRKEGFKAFKKLAVKEAGWNFTTMMILMAERDLRERKEWALYQSHQNSYRLRRLEVVQFERGEYAKAKNN